MEAIKNLFARSELGGTQTDQTETGINTTTTLVFSGLVVATIALVFLKPLPFPWKNPAIALAGLLFWAWYRGGLEELGISKKHSLSGTLLWSVLLTGTSLFVIGDLIGPVIDRLTGYVPDYSHYGDLVGNFDAVFGFWWKAMISAGMAEEIIYNGILLVGLAQLLKRVPGAKHIAIVLSAVVFGIAHYPQGLSGIISTGLVGLTFGYGFYLSGRNIYALILSHCLLDTYAMFILYYGWFDAGI